ncbi:hypothetical protein EX30DRAFT_391968 [Ascodesmis nigricans]|uniref:VHS domain-containing protein n=1 Tax=Ascodesmis nigricans TaxID=341454 RepID=A0A4S2N5S4_9PEZI|nr:hypothetical protein EX30DRAFT_391968 [Ascodesmis nigricans]
MDKLKRKLTKTTKSAAAAAASSYSASGAASTAPPSDNDTPEVIVQRSIHAFTHTAQPGDEVLHLPSIVDNAESSPAAAQIAATNLRKLLAVNQAPRVQYQAVMLLRILSDNPGPTFTRYIGSDSKYVSVIKDLIRRGRDPGVWGILRETLIHWEGEKEADPGLLKVREMWIKEKKLIDEAIARSRPSGGAPPINNPQSAESVPQLLPRQPQKRVPSPLELSSRIAEATSTAKLLEQLIQSTPSNELPENELVKEFGERCRLAQRSLAGYIAAAEDEDVDVDTLATIIETHDIVARAALDLKKRLKEINRQREREAQNAIDPDSRVLDVGSMDMPAHMPNQVDGGNNNPLLRGILGTSSNATRPGTPQGTHQPVHMHGATTVPPSTIETQQYRIPPPPPPPAPLEDKAPSSNGDPFADNAHPLNPPNNNTPGAPSSSLEPTVTTTISSDKDNSNSGLGLGRFWKR